MQNSKKNQGDQDSGAARSFEGMPSDIKAGYRMMRGNIKRFHGMKASRELIPKSFLRLNSQNKFGYMTPSQVRKNSKLSFNQPMIDLLTELGEIMGNSGRESAISNSSIPSGYTYFGQFVDHDITLDITSSLDSPVSATTIENMRTAALELDSVYGRGPVLEPYLYEFPSGGNPTAIKLKLGANQANGPGGPGGSAGSSGMAVQTDFDLPRMSGTLTAVIGDPRNDENLIISQLHSAMLKFHNRIVDRLVMNGFGGDIFVEAKKMATQHYQWAVIHDFGKRICGMPAINQALANISVSVGSAFRMPVEFSVAAYRFGHSMVRESYFLNFNHQNSMLAEVFNFVRNPNLPVLSNCVVDLNAFYETGVFSTSGPEFNMARKIDSVLSSGLEAIPGEAGLMAILAARNLLRGLVFRLPSGQAAAKFFGFTPLSEAQLTSGLPQDEKNILNKKGKLLLKKTPLWYYILREAAVLNNGNQLGPVGAKIVADTLVTMLKRDPGSYLNVQGGFTPSLPSQVSGDFTVADLVAFAGVTTP